MIWLPVKHKPEHDQKEKVGVGVGSIAADRPGGGTVEMLGRLAWRPLNQPHADRNAGHVMICYALSH